MKINFFNAEEFNEVAGKLKLHKKFVSGLVVSSALVIAGGLFGAYEVKKNDEMINDMIQISEFDVDLDGINDMNIFLNDCDCSDTFFTDVCNELNDDGLRFNICRNNENINNDNSILVTLDQQYSSGADTIIFAPYNNTRLGYSDSLALSMQAAFEQNGFLGNKIVCGKVGYREDANGNIISSIPTEVEESLDETADISFVTISFGTQNVNAEWVAKSIENGLARQKCYLDNYDTASDLIYRASLGDSIDEVAKYFGVDEEELNNFNSISEVQPIIDSQAIINPDVKKMDVFNKKSEFNIGEVHTKAY